ncbi:MAG: 4-(cytidine 5'-diphospho)-2-C-methyl-D-erythritol kinase [Candidatus Omnitrophota bacterium]|nr:MAG: 4-(cytidine 5'-diphospho)-2-C-methyl-D-erythritol kinase [Candidatus Omnitrophota bacterium]
MASPLILSLRKQNNFYGSKVKILSPAKINLYLNITGKYSNGYHRIESIVERVSLCDEIKIVVTKPAQIRIFSSQKSLQTKDNLCVKAANLLNKKCKLPFGYDIFLDKRIPVGAGLGGGSSNAASALIALNKLLSLKLTRLDLYKLGSRLGSDVNFFLSQSSFAFIYGRGQYVKPFTAGQYSHFIIWPQLTLSTKKVYEKSRAKLTKFLCNVKILQYALRKADTALIKKNVFNVLEKSACRLCNRLQKVKAYLNGEGIFSKVTGSGSALYTIEDKQSPHNINGGLSKSCLIFKVKTF